MRIVCRRCSARTTIETSSRARTPRCSACGATLEVPAVETGWYAVVRGAMTGPLTRDGLVAVLRNEPAPADVPVWRDGLDPWAAAGEVPELASALADGERPGAIALRDRKAGAGGAASRDGGSGKVDLGALMRQLGEQQRDPAAPPPAFVDTTPPPVSVSHAPRAGSGSRWGIGAAIAACSIATVAVAAWAAWEPLLHDGDEPVRADARAPTSIEASTPAPAIARVARASIDATPAPAPATPAPGASAPTTAAATTATALTLPALEPLVVTVGSALQADPTHGSRHRHRGERADESDATESDVVPVAALAEPLVAAAPAPVAAPPTLPPSAEAAAPVPPSGAAPPPSAAPPPENPFDAARAPAPAGASIDQLLERAVVADPTSDESPGSAPALPPTPTREEVDRGLDQARAAVAACGLVGHGVAQVRITIAGPTGRVTSAVVEGDFAGTPAGSCVARAVRGAQFPRFSRPTFVVQYAFRI